MAKRGRKPAEENEKVAREDKRAMRAFLNKQHGFALEILYELNESNLERLAAQYEWEGNVDEQ